MGAGASGKGLGANGREEGKKHTPSLGAREKGKKYTNANKTRGPKKEGKKKA